MPSCNSKFPSPSTPSGSARRSSTTIGRSCRRSTDTSLTRGRKLTARRCLRRSKCHITIRFPMPFPWHRPNALPILFLIIFQEWCGSRSTRSTTSTSSRRLSLTMAASTAWENYTNNLRSRAVVHLIKVNGRSIPTCSRTIWSPSSIG